MPVFPRRAFILGALLALSACTPDGPGQQTARSGGPPPAAAPHALDAYFNSQWAMDKLWEDGLAEVATYAAERVIYNKVRRFDYTQITVKEEFNQEFNVKTDSYQRSDMFPVLKVNQFCRIPTDQYPYHFLTSLFFRRDRPVALHKLTTSSQEWCGATFKAITDEGDQYTETYNSYWDKQGAGQRQLPHDVLFEDALPYTLRALRFEQKPAFAATILELQQTSKATPPVSYQARVAVAEAAAAEAAEPAWQVRVRLDQEKENVYWFARRYPNVLLRQTTWDGRTLQLTSVRRYAYWTH
ncbi:hypothetical protein E5K00_05655 [Hymenobacter aquaticus]|uniref:Uncharacterized protein n=1 Tax=Hymenobacter aquaticus TaxID=1867101 RepID=A0A4Z0Q3S6_9BACT|nr:hypothetical protein [Hymenobacter aquaticus]TGE24697.1 hypothetical protein E5K00_05655 [Hymenobacter aquaticus]